MTIETFLKIAYLQTTLSGLVAGLCFYRFQIRSKPVILIGLLFFIGCLVDLITVTISIGNIPASFYDFILVIIVGILYDNITNRKFTRWIILITCIFIIFAAYNLLFIQKDAISSYNKLFASFIIISYSVIYFYHLMVELPAVHLQRLPMFWFNSAFLLFHAGAIFLFAFTPYLVNVYKDDLLTYWSFHNFLSILQHFIIFIGLSYDLKDIKDVHRVTSAH